MVSNETWLPTVAELTVPVELSISAPSIKAAAIYMGKACEHDCKEFMLCRSELEDPRKCLKEGAAVTACGVKLLQQMKKHCREEFENYAHCIDFSHEKAYVVKCKEPQRFLDRCAMDKLNLERPKLGYFARLHVHQSDRPKPQSAERDYEAEARKVLDELPKDYPLRKDHTTYKEGKKDFFAH